MRLAGDSAEWGFQAQYYDANISIPGYVGRMQNLKHTLTNLQM